MKIYMNISGLYKKDLKTLEKAVYSGSINTSSLSNQSSSSLNENSEEVLTRHLLKLNEIENQFQQLNKQIRRN